MTTNATAPNAAATLGESLLNLGTFRPGESLIRR
jgi:hypothetical protein